MTRKAAAARLAGISPTELAPALRNSADRQAAMLEVCRVSLRHFAFFIVGGFTDWDAFMHDEDEDGNPVLNTYDENWHHVVWYALMQKYTRLCVLCARGHGKTRAFSWTYPLWRAWKDPGSEGALFSNTEGQAADNLHVIKQIIDYNPILAPLRPARPTKWGALEIETAGKSSIKVRGQGSGVRGMHPNYVVEDDILDEKNCSTEDQRKKVHDWHFSVVEPMLRNTTSPVFLLGTPQAYSDLLMGLKTNGEYLWLKFPATLTREEKAHLLSYI